MTFKEEADCERWSKRQMGIVDTVQCMAKFIKCPQFCSWLLWHQHSVSHFCTTSYIHYVGYMLVLFPQWNVFIWHRNKCVLLRITVAIFAALRCYWIKIISTKNVYNMKNHTRSLWFPSNTVHVKPFDCSHGHSKDPFNLFSGFVCAFFFLHRRVCMRINRKYRGHATSNHFNAQKEIQQLKRIHEIYVSIFLSSSPTPSICVHPFARSTLVRFIPIAC